MNGTPPEVTEIFQELDAKAPQIIDSFQKEKEKILDKQQNYYQKEKQKFQMLLMKKKKKRN
jgi:hypothetical protein